MKGVAALALSSLIALAGTAARADETIKIGSGPVTQAGPLYVAADKGYFAAEHLTADIISLDAAQEVAQGTMAGSLDIGATAATAAAYNLGAKGGLKVIAGQAREMPTFHGSAFLVSNRAWDAGLHSIKDFANHTIGIVQTGGPIHYELQLALDKYHVDNKTIRLVQLQTLPNTATAVAGGQVDAALDVSTFALKLDANKSAHLIAWVGDETPWQNTFFFVSTKTANERGKMIEAFLRAYKKAAREFYDAFATPDGTRRDGPAAPEMLAILEKHLKQPAAQLDSGIPYIDPDAKLDVKDVLHQIEWFKSQRMIPANTDGNSIIDKRYVVPLN
jgi:NitT/TauT family transport system substrate-binding protein